MEKYIVEVVNNEIVKSTPYEDSVPSSLLSYADNVLWSIGVIIFLALTVVIVKQQSLKVIETFGKFQRVAQPGLSFKIPFVQYIAGELDLRITELSEAVTVKSKDNAFVSVPVKVQYQVISEKAEQAFYQLANAKEQIVSYIINVVRSTATELTMQEIFKSKDKFEQDVNVALNQQFNDFGFKVVNVLVDDPQPSKEVIGSFNRVIASEREKEAATNEAEAIRIKMVGKAEAEAQSLTLKAKAYVEQRRTIAEGMKGIVNDADLAAYLVGIDWRDTVRDAAEKGSVILIPSDMKGTSFAETTAALQTVKKP